MDRLVNRKGKPIKINKFNKTTTSGLRISIRGIVQGVGFRPFVYTHAMNHHLTGWVRNTSSGVEIEVSGTRKDLDLFLIDLQTKLPPLARIDDFKYWEIPPQDFHQFDILISRAEEGQFIPISPDISICEECQRELFDPNDRRFRYPFINCTNCGPRFTIIRDIPYDRPNTTMAKFNMCPECEREYEDPLNRRFHAQPIACPECGPQVWLEINGITAASADQSLKIAREMLAGGMIIAIKGLGGYHLACDAYNANSVDELRRRKNRVDKPFALMAYDLRAIENNVLISPSEKELLLSRQRPILLLERKQNSLVAEQVAPKQSLLGFMLPYTPLHLLLMEPDPTFPEVLVMTSGNLSEEPIAYQDNDARKRLASLADGFLIHNRPIHIRTDDTVIRTFRVSPYFIRRARGYAPDPVRLPKSLPSILATGTELKNTFCLTHEEYAFISHHIGDMENYETLRSFEEGIEHFERLFRVHPEYIACDLHPDYLATHYAICRSQEDNIPLFQIQHHHAHIASCLADNDWETDEPVIGIIFDGTGYGTDGKIWGGEILYGGYRYFERLYHLKNVPLPGGDLAIRIPARMALTHLWSSGIDWQPDLAPIKQFCEPERTALKSQLDHLINSPMTSSMGRLFDAASSLIGICHRSGYEGQAAIELEALAARDETTYYSMEICDDEIDPAPLWQQLLNDIHTGIQAPILAAKFHNSIIEVVRAACHQIRQHNGCNTIALSGGVWQNCYLLSRAFAKLDADGFNIMIHSQVPTNDGGVSLGQALVASSMVNA